MLISKSVRPANKGWLHPVPMGLRSLASEESDANQSNSFASQDIANGNEDAPDRSQDVAGELQHAWWHFLPPCSG